MCDTFVAQNKITRDGSTIFAKNSDRDANEAHEVLIIPHKFHDKNEKLKCTYVEIPQVKETNSILLLKPFWIWGAEMGANEFGVVIGNEAVFSKVPAGKKPGLIGMDYLRLALERASTARSALEVITSLLEIHGQSGNCGFSHSLYYHNSYLIVDPSEAWILETVDRHWAAKKVEGFSSISNGLTIENDFNFSSEDLINFAQKRGWCKSKEDFSFRRCYSDIIMTFGSDAKKRQCRTSELINRKNGEMELKDAMAFLRDHGDGGSFSPDKKLMGAEVCMHHSGGPVRISQTTGSLVSQFKDGQITHWVTGTSSPCTGLFKPLWLDAGLPQIGLNPKGNYHPDALWWRHEDLHRAVLEDYLDRIAIYEKERDKIEYEFIEQTQKICLSDVDSRLEFSQNCFDKSLQKTKEWTEKVVNRSKRNKRSIIHKMTWKKLDKIAKRLT